MQVINFPVQVSCLYGLEWSQDYRLALATKKGIYILSLIADPTYTNTEINFCKSFIPNQQSSNGADVLLSQERLSGVNLELYYRIAQDRVMSPFMEPSDSFSHMRYIGWTPQIQIGKSSGIFLAALSVDYSFRIYEVKFDSWRILVDLSQIIVAYMDTNPQLIKTYCLETAERQDYEDLFCRAYLYATTSVHWDTQTSFTSGQEGGQVIFWSLKGEQLMIEKILQPRLGAVSALTAHICRSKSGSRKYTFIGSTDGRVAAISDRDDKVHPVWEERDHLKVTRLTSCPVGKSNDTYTLLICKLSFIVALKIKLLQKSVQVLEKTVLNAGVSHVVGIEQQLVKAPVSRTACTAQSSFDLSLGPLLVAPQKGQLTLWDTFAGGETNKSQLQLPLERRDYAAWGLSASPNKAIYSLLECVSAFNDHLMLREPSRVVFFTLTDTQHIRGKLQDVFLPDYMEIYRTLYLSKGDDSPEQIGNIQSVWWWANMMANQRQDTTANTTQNSTTACATLSQLEKQMRCAAALAFLRTPDSDKVGKYSSAKYLKKFSSGSQLVKEADAALISLKLPTWKCKICGSEAASENVRTVICLNKHRFARCGVTQQPCDVSSLMGCAWCKAVYSHTSLAIRCIFCSGPLK